MSNEQSPDFLAHKSIAKGIEGVRRLNKVPLFIGIFVLTAILGAIAYTVMDRNQNKAAAAATEPEIVGPAEGKSQEIMRDAPTEGVIEAHKEIQPLPTQLPQENKLSADQLRIIESRRQERERIRQAKIAALESALTAETTVKTEQQNSDSSNIEDVANNRVEEALSALSSRGIGAGKMPPTGMALLARAGLENGGDDNSNRAEKRNFLKETQKDSTEHYLSETRTAPVSPYEVKQGTVIPAVLISGVNSDLPGQLLAQVSENIWDTATGRFLLIPQGSKLVGTYDSEISAGQERVMVAWTRVIFPDASSLNLGAMPGADQAGYAGFTDQVNNHYFRAFGHALLLSVFSAGVQLSQPQGKADSYSAQQVVAGSIGQQLGTLGMEMARKNMQIQPTLEVRPGYRFVVNVTRDMVLRPWVDET